jgi:hypothetical protein
LLTITTWPAVVLNPARGEASSAPYAAFAPASPDNQMFGDKIAAAVIIFYLL